MNTDFLVKLIFASFHFIETNVCFYHTLQNLVQTPKNQGAFKGSPPYPLLSSGHFVID